MQRALGLGVDSGVVFDLGSQLGLVPLKILWHNEGLFGISLHTSGKPAERARETADAWELGERMFFQIGKPQQMKFKSNYFHYCAPLGGSIEFSDKFVTPFNKHRFVGKKI